VDTASSFYSEGECKRGGTFSGRSGSLELVSLTFDKASVLRLGLFGFSNGLLVGNTSGLDHGALFLILSDFLEEFLFDGGKLLLELVGDSFVSFLLLGGLLVGEALGDIKGLLSAEFSLEDGEHNLLFGRLKSVIIKSGTKAEHGGSTFGITNSGH
jgi:hypothetical protein